MTVTVNLPEGSYDILLERGGIRRVGETVGNHRRVMILTDSGVPEDYAATVKRQFSEAFVFTVPAGERSKNFETLQAVLREMVTRGFRREDCVVAVGGGVVGDLGGFAASCYMRGIGFYNVPTTLLSQVDSSVGGKTAIDFEGVKNVVGSFYQPRGVFIDPDVLKTLPRRQFSSGMAEIVKVALTSDARLFERLEKEAIGSFTEEMIAAALNVKKAVVERDERENGLRRVLNFGHTLGHGIESEQNGKLFHGECVALGMIPMTSETVRGRLLPVLAKCGLQTEFDGDPERVMQAVLHDKKAVGNEIMTIIVDKIGSYREEKQSPESLKQRLSLIEKKEEPS